MTPELCRGARGLLNMTQNDLATAARISLKTLVSFENGKSTPLRKNLEDIRAALEEAGVEFSQVEGGAVCIRLREQGTQRRKK